MEIISYLNIHKEVKNYCIIDDDYYFKTMSKHMIKLTSRSEGGNGLNKGNIKKAIKILKNNKEV